MVYLEISLLSTILPSKLSIIVLSDDWEKITFLYFFLKNYLDTLIMMET